MVTLFEGIVLQDPNNIPNDPLNGTVQVLLEEPQLIVNALINRVHGLQQVHIKGSKVLVYRTYNNQARVILNLDDQPAQSPIWKDNTSASTYFQPGEVAVRASGDPTSNIPQDGGLLWCKNSGDVSLYSGSMTQKLSVSDISQSVNLSGNNISLATNTSFKANHVFTLSTDLIGLPSSRWGIQNPITGIFTNSISISEMGTINLNVTPLLSTINIGVSIPVLGTNPFDPPLPFSLGDITETVLVSGIQFTTVPSTTNPTLVDGGISLIAPGVSIAATQISLAGGVTLKGLFDITGATTLKGLFNVVGSVDSTLGYSSNSIPGVTGAFVIHPGSVITVVGGIVTLVT